MVATTFSHYRIVDLLAVGGMGVVYRADDVILNRPVALKFLAPESVADEEYRARFLREARVAAALNHPNVCTVYEVGEVEVWHASANESQTAIAPGTPFIAMEFIEGETLAAWLSRDGQLPAKQALDVALQIAEGLAEAHLRQILHRDLKPHNVMVARGGRVKIVDFGLAKPIVPARGEKVVVSTSEMISADLGGDTIVGTCAYMSPEQAAGKPLDARSDMFAFGIMLYQMVAGRLPFHGESSTEILAKILEAEPAPIPATAMGVPEDLIRIIWRCLRKKPGERYRDTLDLVQGLRDVRRQLSGDGGIRTWPKTAKQRIASLQPFVVRPVVLLPVLFVVALSISYSLFRLPGGNSQGPTNRGPSTTGRQTVATSADTRSTESPRPTSDALKPLVPATPPQAPVATERDAANRQPEDRPFRATTSDTQQPSVPAGLVVTSTPRSSVSLDGNLVGVTPLTLNVEPGTHMVTLTSPEGMRWRGRIDVRAGGTNAVDRNLAATGGLTIVSDTWAEVSLDQQLPEQTPIHFPRVASGLHEIRASRDGYVTQVLEVFIEEGKTATVRLALEKRQ